MQDSPTPLVMRLCCRSSVSGICSRCCEILPHDELEQGVALQTGEFCYEGLQQQGLQSPVTNPTFASRLQYYGQLQMWYPGGAFSGDTCQHRKQRCCQCQPHVGRSRSEMSLAKPMYMISANIPNRTGTNCGTRSQGCCDLSESDLGRTRQS